MILRPWAASAAPVARNVTRGPWRAHDSSVAQRVGTRGYSSAPTLGGQPLGMEAPWETRTPTAVRDKLVPVLRTSMAAPWHAQVPANLSDEQAEYIGVTQQGPYKNDHYRY